MRIISTLLSGDERIAPEVIKQTSEVLAGIGAANLSVNLISQGVAADFIYDAEDISLARARLNAFLHPHALDHITRMYPQPALRLLISDMDSTMITCECIDELADFAGVKSEVERITELAMNGELDFAQALIRRVSLLKGLPVEMLQKTYESRVKFSTGAKDLVQAFNAKGGHSVLVSGGFDFFTSRVSEELGFHQNYGNRLGVSDGISNGTLTGEVIPPILDKHSKLHTLNEMCEKLGIQASQVIALGDGANDLPMLQAAGLGIAYRAKPVVRAMAEFELNFASLDKLIYVL
jgi:phosphoserine phosphatase